MTLQSPLPSTQLNNAHTPVSQDCDLYQQESAQDCTQQQAETDMSQMSTVGQTCHELLQSEAEDYAIVSAIQPWENGTNCITHSPSAVISGTQQDLSESISYSNTALATPSLANPGRNRDWSDGTSTRLDVSAGLQEQHRSLRDDSNHYGTENGYLSISTDELFYMDGLFANPEPLSMALTPPEPVFMDNTFHNEAFQH